MLNTKESIQLFVRRTFLVLMDIVLICMAAYLALLMRFDLQISKIEAPYHDNIIRSLPIIVIVTLAIFTYFRIYSSLWEYASIKELGYIAMAAGVSAVFQMGLMVMTARSMPRSYYFLYYFLLVLLVGTTRIVYRCLRTKKYEIKQIFFKKHGKKVMIVGAGKAGSALIREIQTSEHLNYTVCCLMDIDTTKHGKYIHGVPVVGDRNDIVYYAKKYKIHTIFIALPKLSAKELQPILEVCQQTNCEIKKMPAIYQLMNGEVTVTAMKDVAIEDLLGRDPIRVKMDKIFGQIAGKVIMVTGGGGSIGSELCRQIAEHRPSQLIVLDMYENSVYEIQQELRKKYPDLNLKVLIGSVRDSRRLKEIFEKYRPEIVYHAAAHKHVPLMEDSPNESIKNNVIGTYKTAYEAMRNGCQKFVLISTDKAVNPTNIMGASKRLCEMVIQSFDAMIKAGKADQIPVLCSHKIEEAEEKAICPEKIHTEFVAVRFGNVLGSNGSVIPLFKKQIAEGGPVTVTHPDIIRYFMTIPEAISLVLQAGTYAKGGEIFVLDMGSPVKIDSLARNLIRLSGHKPDEDIKIVYTGLRPGEKLYEEKLMAEEGLKTTENELIHIGCPIPFDTEEFLKQLETLAEACMFNSKEIRTLVAEMVNTYRPA